MLYQKTEHPATQLILNWFSVWEGMEGYRILRSATLPLEDLSLTPAQKMYRVWRAECAEIFHGRKLYGRSWRVLPDVFRTRVCVGVVRVRV
eukprot:1087748-Rhodomonas_salina.1